MNKQFSLILKSLRTNNGYTQKELAKLLDIGQTTIANYENGTRVPDIGKIIEIADLFKVSVDCLLGRDKNKSDKQRIINKNIVKSLDLNYIDYLKSLLDGNKEKATEICLNLLQSGIDVVKIYNDVIEPSLLEIGTLWEKGVIDIWKEHFISEVSIDIMTILHSKISYVNKINKNLIALTPGPEMHNIGLRMVAHIFELKGWNSLYLGSNVPTKSILDVINEEKPQAIALSITMPNHIESAHHMINAIRQTHKKDSLSIIVGGSVLNNFDRIHELKGADYYFSDIEELTSQFDTIL